MTSRASSIARPTPWFETDAGELYAMTIEELLDSEVAKNLRGEVNLIFTSPPFPLNRKKAYGNLQGDEYLEWLAGLAPRLAELLATDGSIVIELGNAWVKGEPVMSTLTLEALLAFRRAGELNLCQQFICHNPARLPSPAQWVNIERIRVKDSFTHVWWMSPNARPKADNRKVLKPYSDSMLKLLETGDYNAGARPSGHVIGATSFNKDNGGAIPPNVLEIANTSAAKEYRSYCRDEGLSPHPAPMQPQLVEFFVEMLTDRRDLVLDPFAGSNTTGAVAESLSRRWISCESNEDYAEGSVGRFPVAAAAE